MLCLRAGTLVVTLGFRPEEPLVPQPTAGPDLTPVNALLLRDGKCQRDGLRALRVGGPAPLRARKGEIKRSPNPRNRVARVRHTRARAMLRRTFLFDTRLDTGIIHSCAIAVDAMQRVVHVVHEKHYYGSWGNDFYRAKSLPSPRAQ